MTRMCLQRIPSFTGFVKGPTPRAGRELHSPSSDFAERIYSTAESFGCSNCLSSLNGVCADKSL